MTRIAYIVPKDITEDVLKECLALAKRVHVDELDCSVSFARKPTTLTVEDVVKMGLDKNEKLVFIHRDMSFIQDHPNYWDIGFAIICAPGITYFLWIDVDETDGFNIADKYKLKEQR